MKKLILICLLSFFGKLSAQYSFAVTSWSQIDLDTKEKISTTPMNEIYNISLKDNILVHNVLDENGSLYDSQLYKIIEQKDNKGVLLLTCKSGVSGNNYEFILSKNDSGNMQLFKFLDGNLYLLQGSVINFKTFKQ